MRYPTGKDGEEGAGPDGVQVLLITGRRHCSSSNSSSSSSSSSAQAEGQGRPLQWGFPKGGWEEDESAREAAARETVEEAGVRGVLEVRCGAAAEL